jgi:hypothetical protein
MVRHDYRALSVGDYMRLSRLATQSLIHIIISPLICNVSKVALVNVLQNDSTSNYTRSKVSRYQDFPLKISRDRYFPIKIGARYQYFSLNTDLKVHLVDITG